MKSGMFRIYLFLKDETGDDYIGKIKFMCSPAEFSSFAGICCLWVYSFNLIHIPVLIIEHNIEFISHVADYLVDVGRNAGNKGNTKA